MKPDSSPTTAETCCFWASTQPPRSCCAYRSSVSIHCGSSIELLPRPTWLLVLALRGEVEESCARADDALTFATEISHRESVDRVRGVHFRLMRWKGHPAVRQLTERLQAGVACAGMTTSVGLEWLRPELDRCRALIADHKSPRRWTKSEQGRSELVTEVDLAIERLLIDAIRQRVPDAAILSEESNADPSALEQDTCFVIDPIDGTEEFAAGRPGFGISIACVRARPAGGGGARHAGSRLAVRIRRRRRRAPERQGVRLSQVDALAEARLAVSATQYEMDSLRPFWDGVGAAGLIPTPAFTPKFAAVLAGECDAALYLPIRPHRTAIWDYAAAAQLLSEAGGWFGATDGTDLLQALPFEYSGGWVAAPPSLRDQLLARRSAPSRWTILASARIARRLRTEETPASIRKEQRAGRARLASPAARIRPTR